MRRRRHCQRTRGWCTPSSRAPPPRRYKSRPSRPSCPRARPHSYTHPTQRAAHKILACCWWPAAMGAIMVLYHWQGKTTVSAHGAAATPRTSSLDCPSLDCPLPCPGEGHHGRWPEGAPHEHRGGAGRRADGFWDRHSLPHRRHHGHPQGGQRQVPPGTRSVPHSWALTPRPASQQLLCRCLRNCSDRNFPVQVLQKNSAEFWQFSYLQH